MTTRERFFGCQHAFDHPVTVGIVLGLAGVLVVAPLVIAVLGRSGRISTELRSELWQRYCSWLILIPCIGLPVLLGAAWTIAATCLLSLLCYQEYARATGLFREKRMSLVVVVGILAVFFAVLDHWYGFFVALGPLTVCLIAAVAILQDQPKGYIQRVGLATIGFMLFGVGLSHLGYMANDDNYRPIVLMLLLTVELNDVFAFVVGKTLGRRKLVPNTSPNKTLGGAAGALVLTTLLVAVLAHYIFTETPLDNVGWLLLLGVLVSVAGQLGDLMLSSIKRDLGIKDMGATIPGHGGLLDRFNSLLLVAPTTFHYVGFFVGFGLDPDQQRRIITGG
jgi:phosphatidate cytidylyltransferase